MSFSDKWKKEFSEVVEAFSGTSEKIIIIDTDFYIRFVSYALQPVIFNYLQGKSPLSEEDMDIIRRAIESRAPLEGKNFAGMKMLFIPLCSEQGEIFGIIGKAISDPSESNVSPSNFRFSSLKELQTSLGFILSSLKLIYTSLPEPATEKQLKYFSMAQQSCFRILKETENSLELLLLKAGNASPLMYTEVNLKSFLTDIYEKCRPIYKTTGRTLNFICELSNKNFYFDQKQIQKVLLFLLSNAMKLTNSGSHIALKAHESEDSLIINIAYKSETIPSDTLAKILNERNFSDVFTQYMGSGSEFILCRSIIERHGGTMLFLTGTSDQTLTIAISLPKDATPYMTLYDTPSEFSSAIPPYDESLGYDRALVTFSDCLGLDSGVSFFKS